MKNKLLLLSIVSTFLFGCTVQKRQYFNGYNIQWVGNLTNKHIYAKEITHTKNNSDIESDYKEQHIRNYTVKNNSKKNTHSLIGKHNNKNSFSQRYHESKSSNINRGTFKNTTHSQNKKEISAGENQYHNNTSKEKSKGNYLLYLTSLLMVGSAMGAIRLIRKKTNRLTRRMGATLGGLLVHLLILTTCAGVALAAVGFFDTWILGIILGIVIVILSVWAIIALMKNNPDLPVFNSGPIIKFK